MLYISWVISISRGILQGIMFRRSAPIIVQAGRDDGPGREWEQTNVQEI